MTGTEIINKFHLQVDDASELSTSEELDLANDIYHEICDYRPWEWLQKSYSGSTSTSVPYIALPSDFKVVVPSFSGLRNGSFTNLGVPLGYVPPYTGSFTNMPVVFVGTNRTPYMVTSYNSRNNYTNTDGFCYIDVPNSRLVFCLQPTSVQTITYDYISIPPDITASTSPIFRSAFHKVIPFGMAARFNNLELTDKSVSYQQENQTLYNSILQDMAVEDEEQKVVYV